MFYIAEVLAQTDTLFRRRDKAQRFALFPLSAQSSSEDMHAVRSASGFIADAFRIDNFIDKRVLFAVVGFSVIRCNAVALLLPAFSRIFQRTCIGLRLFGNKQKAIIFRALIRRQTERSFFLHDFSVFECIADRKSERRVIGRRQKRRRQIDGIRGGFKSDMLFGIVERNRFDNGIPFSRFGFRKRKVFFPIFQFRRIRRVRIIGDERHILPMSV